MVTGPRLGGLRLKILGSLRGKLALFLMISGSCRAHTDTKLRSSAPHGMEEDDLSCWLVVSRLGHNVPAGRRRSDPSFSRTTHFLRRHGPRKTPRDLESLSQFLKLFGYRVDTVARLTTHNPCSGPIKPASSTPQDGQPPVVTALLALTLPSSAIALADCFLPGPTVQVRSSGT